jgi:hypothetical protein
VCTRRGVRVGGGRGTGRVVHDPATLALVMGAPKSSTTHYVRMCWCG